MSYPPAGLTRRLCELTARVLEVPPTRIDPRRPIGSYGLDSLAAVELAHAIEIQLGVALPIIDFLQDLSAEQLAALILAEGQAPHPAPALPREQPAEAPLSYGQRALWLLHRLAPQSAAHNIAHAVRIDAGLDAGALRRAFQALVDRHPMLRATFDAPHGEPRQRFHERAEVWFEQDDAAAWSDAALRQRMAEAAGHPFDLECGPLLRIHLFRRSAREHVLLLVMHHIATDFWSLTVLARELGALYQGEMNGVPASLPPLDAHYADYVAWQAATLAGPEGERLWSYWRARLAGANDHEGPPVLNLPADRARPPAQTNRGGAHAFVIDARLGQALGAIAQANGATLYMVLLAAFQVLLHRYTDQDDLLIGSPVAGRSSARFAGVVGYFMNPLPLRADLAGDPTFTRLLDQARDTVLGALAHQDYPAHLLAERLRPARDRGSASLFQVMFILNRPHGPAHDGALFALSEPTVPALLGGLRLAPLPIPQQAVAFDLTLMIVEAVETLSASFQYNADRFGPTTIARLAGHFQGLLAGIAADPARRIGELPLLPAAERQQLLVEWNSLGDRGQGTGNRELEPSTPICLHQLFEAQAAYTPDAIAVMFEAAVAKDEGRRTKDERQTTNDKRRTTVDCELRTVSCALHLTYRELNRRANQLARYLRRLGIEPDGRVGISMERSPELIVGLLGVLKAGGAYVPLDPAYPSERISFMLEDSGAVLVIVATDRHSDKVTRRQADKERINHRVTLSACHLVDLEADWPAIAQESAANLAREVSAGNLAYIIYTSGSTGQPKGVMIAHGALAAYAATATRAYALTAADRVLQFASISFDISVEEIFLSLASGAALVLRTEAMLGSAATFLARCRDWAISILDLPTAYWHELTLGLAQAPAALPPSLRLVIIGGERALPERRNLWLRHADRRVRLVNTYGPTEATIIATLGAITDDARDAASEVAIGRALDHVAVYVLDRTLRPAPIGVPGQLYIGGAGLARGYLGRPDLTAAAFVPNPFAGTIDDRRWTMEEAVPSSIVYRPSSDRLYKTGDLARYRADGSLEFLGRADGQVKLRGFRVELGEVEAALQAHPAVREAVVLVHAGIPGDPRLVAYIVQGSGVSDPPIGDEGRRTKDERPATEDRRLKIEDSDADVSESLSSILYPLSSELRSFLQGRLPDYMIPAAFVLLDALPRTPSGKLARGALPAPDQESFAAGAAYVAPCTPLEEVIAGIWADVLGLDRVGIADNFFELGGHSLLTMQVLTRMRDVFQFEPSLADFFARPTVAALAEQVARATHAARLADTPPIRPVPRDQPLPLSFPQEHIWFLNQLDPASASYYVPRAIRFTGRLAVGLVQYTFGELVRRHEVLRTTFPTVAGRPVQQIHPPRPVRIPLLDLRALAGPEREAEVERRIRTEGLRPFDLAAGPLLRLLLLRLSETMHVLILTEHHLIHDGWSQGVLMQEFIAIYRAFAAGRPSPLPDLSVQFADFAHWQREWLQGETLARELAHWRARLAGAPAVLNLPLDRPRPAAPSYQGAEQVFVVRAGLAEELRALSRRAGCTLFMTMLAVFEVLLHRYSRQEDILVGSVVANRRWRETERMLGMVINTLVLRTDLAGDPTFRELMQRVRATCLDAYAHQDVPFEKIVEVLAPARSLSYNPLFQAMFGFQDTPTPEMELPGLTLELLDSHNRSAKFDLDVTVLPRAEQLTGLRAGAAESEIVVHVEYNTDIFDHDTIALFVAQFQALLRQVVAEPDRRIGELPLLGAADRDLLIAWNDTAADYPRTATIPALFEAQVDRTPDAVAVVADEGRTTNDESQPSSFVVRPSSSVVHLTYHALDRRANRLARHLRALGVRSEALVAVLLERSPELAIGLLGILKAGGAYLPLDPDYPAERLAFMLEDSAARILVTNDERRTTNDERRRTNDERRRTDKTDYLVALSACHLVKLGADWPLIARAGDARLDGGASADNLAYVIYTSGSTGRPKGVLITHRAVVNHNLAIARDYGLGGDDRVMHAASISFDFAVEELFPPWLHGAAVVLAPPGLLVAVPQVLRWVERMRLTALLLPTAYWHEWVRQIAQAEQPLPAALRLVAIGGERALPERLRAWQALPNAHTTWINTYGPTEATVSAIRYAVAPGEPVLSRAEVPIGRPLANVQAYVLDRFQRPVPPGVPGELYLGGVGLARGYLGRPDLTAERFIPNPLTTKDEGRTTNDESEPSSFVVRPSSRLYRTGDLVRYLPSGMIEYLGRVDQQIKLRGFRIEPGEIEAVLRSHPDVREAVVLLTGERLVAYVVPTTKDEGRRTNEESEPSSFVIRHSSLADELRRWLKDRLPAYMLPSAFVLLDALPLTPNGKLDRKALPAPDGERPDLEVAYVAPRTPVEEQLARLWAEVLEVDRVGIYDNFFTLGGHSLLATQLNNKLRQTFQVDLLLRRIFEAPNVAGMAALIVDMQAAQADQAALDELLSELESLSDEAARALLAGSE